jgi:hypothetical protein
LKVAGVGQSGGEKGEYVLIPRSKRDILRCMPQEQKSKGFYYHAAGYANEQLSSEVFQNLDSSIKHSQFNLSTFRILVSESNVWAVVVIGEKPDAEFDALILEYLANTGEIVELPDDVLRTLLARRPDMN